MNHEQDMPSIGSSARYRCTGSLRRSRLRRDAAVDARIHFPQPPRGNEPRNRRSLKHSSRHCRSQSGGAHSNTNDVCSSLTADRQLFYELLEERSARRRKSASEPPTLNSLMAAGAFADAAFQSTRGGRRQRQRTKFSVCITVVPGDVGPSVFSGKSRFIDQSMWTSMPWAYLAETDNQMEVYISVPASPSADMEIIHTL